MAHFYATAEGDAEQILTRAGTKSSGVIVNAAGKSGTVETVIWYDRTHKVDRYRVLLRPWGDSPGLSRVLCEGILDATAPPEEG
jgi:hypothetical protein